MQPVLRNALFLFTTLSLALAGTAALSAPYSAEGAGNAKTTQPAKPAKKDKRKHPKADVSPMAQPDSMSVPIGPTPPASTSPGGPGPLQ